MYKHPVDIAMQCVKFRNSLEEAKVRIKLINFHKTHPEVSLTEEIVIEKIREYRKELSEMLTES